MRHCWIALFLVATIAGCSSPPLVEVVDPSGKPIEGANVQAVSLSINSLPNATNKKGEALLPANIQGAKWVLVTKPGYEPKERELPMAWPLRITLTPEIKP